MGAERFWAAAWVTLFLPALVGLCGAFLPTAAAIQLAVAPGWVAWWVLTAGPRLRVWAALWGGALLEWAWGVPPGACVLPLLGLWAGARAFRESMPERPRAVHGLVGGMVAVPALRVWLWLYAMPWVGPEAAGALRPGLSALCAAPAAGALGGCAVFALARACDFLALRPPREEARADAG